MLHTAQYSAQTVHYTQHSAVQYSLVQYGTHSAVQCSTLQYSIVQE
jgi:hypothetical protein